MTLFMDFVVYTIFRSAIFPYVESNGEMMQQQLFKTSK